MNTILKIYKRDLKRIIINPALIIILIGLIIVPALYAWINIIASWDPYGNTKNLLVAIVNNDRGAAFKNIQINVGKEVADKLKTNQNIGWTFVNQNEAETGVKYGKYYASITIPEDFSKDLLSIATSKEPEKAKLIYSVNEKVNAIAPKITKSGLTSLQSEITSSFTQEASSTALNYMNAYGIELEKARPEIEKFMSLISNIDNDLPKVGDGINAAYQLSNDMHNYIQNIEGSIPIVTDTLNKSANIVKASNDFLLNVNNKMKNIPTNINADLTTSKNNVDSAIDGLNNVIASINQGNIDQTQALKSISDKLNAAITSIDNNINMMKSINNVLNSNAVSNFISNLQDIRDRLAQNNDNLNNLINTLNKGQQISTSALKAIIQNVNIASQRINDSIDNYNNNIAPLVIKFMDNSIGITDNSLKLLQNAQDNMPLVNSLLKDADVTTNLGVSQIKNIKDKFPAIQQSIHSTVGKFKDFSSEQKFNDIINLLQSNTKAVSDFLSNPITLVQNRVFPIPNYGSAMTPFYTTLAIWVGAFTLLSLLSIKVEPLEDNKKVSAKKEFFGRYLTFATITVIQALVISLGNLFILKTYALNPIIFILFSVYVSIVFIMVIYTLVSVFGNVGKALALVIMVLQVSASGGTFPIQLTPRFFQNISPLLPFTYAIGGMREAEGGIIWSSLYYNMEILSIYFFISIIIAIFLKEKINKKSEKFISKIKESGLIGE
ncbi:YhgE/Pip family protein [Clostridium thailandense]|uniref:YhgE/Pip domain-containing protein n=1 Tax=Clostridium thailandense TaxID=2794346 RepID=UPI003988DF32